MDIGSMVDGKFLAKRFSKLLGSKNLKMRVPRLIFGALVTLPSLIKAYGLNPGEKLNTWIAERLSENGIHTLADLQKITDSLPEGLVHRETGEQITNYDTSLKIIVADITTSTKVIFPKMAPMYWQKPEEISPSCLARSSSSVPFFFQPFKVSGVSEIEDGRRRWEELGSYDSVLPEKVLFVDGGILSSFPIDLYKRTGVPRAPTFGALFGSVRRGVKGSSHIGEFVESLYGAQLQYMNYDFFLQNPLYQRVITHIPTEKYFWLDFNMSYEDKLGLFREGVLAGYKFLENFNWIQYKEMRANEFKMMKSRLQTIQNE
jgi:NTE family protein